METQPPDLAWHQSFEHPAQQIPFQNYLNAVDQAQARRDEVDVQIRQFAAAWSMAPVLAKPSSGAAVVSFHSDPLRRDVMHSRHARWRRAPFVAEHGHL